MALPFGSVDGVKAVLRSSPPTGGGESFIRVPEDIAESRVEHLLNVTAEEIISKIGFQPVANYILKEINNKLAAWHVYMEVWSSAGQFERGIPEQVSAWRLWAFEKLEDPDFVSSLEPETSTEVVSPEEICEDFVRIQDESIIFYSDHDSFLGTVPIIEGSEEVRTAKRGGGTVFKRGTDYHIWYADGRMRVISGGSITIGQQLYVTYHAVRRREFLDKISSELDN